MLIPVTGCLVKHIENKLTQGEVLKTTEDEGITRISVQWVGRANA